MEFCKELGFTNVCFEGNAKVVVDEVNVGSEDVSRRGQLVGNLRSAIEAYRGCL